MLIVDFLCATYSENAVVTVFPKTGCNEKETLKTQGGIGAEPIGGVAWYQNNSKQRKGDREHDEG